ncbi:Hypothetical protein mma_2525 [Janthinobacterium sp. Marseille]|nr:hypothetical protein [Janthinobacterium sp. Marseille]ABR91889.1 Hypothetical protein mma_2525 [Janthinobacterium sp. Marseille]
MSVIIYSIGGIFIAWFVFGVIKKLSYFDKVEQSLRKMNIEPRTIQDKVGKQKYINAMSFLKRKGVPPEATAGLLKINVINGMGELMVEPPTDPDEYKFLELLGYIKK